MVTQMEATGKWLEQVGENFRKASEAGLKLQQDLIKQATKEWPKFTESNLGSDQVQGKVKEWRESLRGMMERYRTALNADFEAGIQSLDEAFQVSEAKDFEDYRDQLKELFRKNYETLKNMAEVNVQEYKTTVEEWMELTKKMSC